MQHSFETIDSLLKKLKKGYISRLDLTKHFLKIIYEKNSSLNAIISLRSQESIEQYLQQIENSQNINQVIPPLTGFPIAIKDLENTQGLLTTHGSPIFRENIPKSDSNMVRNIKQSGCIIIGKTNVPEFGVGSQTYNTLFGSTRNPFNTNLTAGGSSGGAAAAVAAGMLPFADGSDMMGSLRNPAAFCSVYGFRPSPDLIPTEAFSGSLPRLSSLGGIANSTKCISYLLDAQLANFTETKGHKSKFSEKIEIPINKKEIRLGWLGSFNGGYIYETGIEHLCKEYLNRLDSSRVKVNEVSPNFSPKKLWESWTTLRCVKLKQDLGEHYSKYESKNLLKQEILWEIEMASSVTATKLEQALDTRKEWISCLKELFRKYDFLLLPSAQVFPFAANKPYPTEINGRKLDTYHRWMEVVVPASLAGLPTISIPCGFNKKGLPMGIQLMGDVKKDLDVLKFSKLIEEMAN